ncbi:hypothetical protein HPP92_022174 [Vanilla planifolia]|uniref:Uncharacterized protein n=1 Tax=Vanilla planifolia TaxID=51239 RepID=A0A835PV76_VANPL|nr:hypothetical protein HPP92_022174 [Vanilla planifolia]
MAKAQGSSSFLLVHKQTRLLARGSMDAVFRRSHVVSGKEVSETSKRIEVRLGGKKMLLRSSSTPILGSLLSSSQFFSEIPINAFQHHPSSLERTTSSPSFLRAISCRISPISDPSDLDPSTAIRRTRSEGNINGLLHQKSPKPPSSTGNSFLEQAPKTEEDQMGHDKQPNEADVSFLSEKQIPSVDKNAGQRVHWAPQPLFLARGLGIDRLGSGFLNLSGNGSDFVGTDGQDGIHTVKTKYGGEGNQIEAYYKRMVEDNPTNPMILRNYAQFLYQVAEPENN